MKPGKLYRCMKPLMMFETESTARIYAWGHKNSSMITIATCFATANQQAEMWEQTTKTRCRSCKKGDILLMLEMVPGPVTTSKMRQERMCWGKAFRVLAGNGFEGWMINLTENEDITPLIGHNETR